MTRLAAVSTMLRAALVVGCAAALAAGCTTRPSTTAAAPPAGSPAATPWSGPARSAEDNRRAADAEAHRLLGLAVLPPGARPGGTAPARLDQPVLGRGSAADAAGYWQVDRPVAEVTAWLRIHPPAGLTFSGTSGPDPIGFAYTGTATAAFDVPWLEIGVTALGPGRSGVRADGVVVWLDPRPWPDQLAGPRLTVSLAGGCPAGTAGAVGVTPSRPALTDRLIPATAPSAALLCQYDGAGHRLSTVDGDVRLGPGAAGQLADALRRTTLSHPVNDARTCPMDDGSVIVIVLAEPGRADVAVWYAPRGCSRVANGTIAGTPVGLAEAIVAATA